MLELKSSLSMASENLIEELHFENLVIKVDAQDFFKLKNQKFHVGTISWKNCEINDLQRTMWYQEVDAAQKQIVDRVCIENCRILGLNSGKSGLFGRFYPNRMPRYMPLNLETRLSTPMI